MMSQEIVEMLEEVKKAVTETEVNRDLRMKHTFIPNIPPTSLIFVIDKAVWFLNKNKENADVIDQFVDYLIKENCEGCTECEPRASADWKPNFACCEEGRAKWFMEMAKRFKEMQ